MKITLREALIWAVVLGSIFFLGSIGHRRWEDAAESRTGYDPVTGKIPPVGGTQGQP